VTDLAKKLAHIIVFGNEKGGTGKSTTAMHVAISLIKNGSSVAIVDLDSRQKSLYRYAQNRKNNLTSGYDLVSIAEEHVFQPSELTTIAENNEDEKLRLGALLKELATRNDFIIIDCPGNDTNVARLAHSIADTLVTPLNDSFVDLDLLGEVDEKDFSVKRLSHYSETVWESRKQRVLYGKKALDWIVLRNRIAVLNSRNTQRVHAALEELQKKISFRYVPGLTERVVYRELFPQGLTLLDIQSSKKSSMSHVAARFEIKQLVESMNLPGVVLA